MPSDNYEFEMQGSTSCQNGEVILDEITCREACNELNIPIKEINGGHVCYKHNKGSCRQDGGNGKQGTLICKKCNKNMLIWNITFK